ncbi:pentapeptide repeat-containing protein [Sulfuriflexus mobilis]|uniref:pentapeptide repeat-containing protein n=1 Tax=Sulfuriflexus mobilis TaxID=1811807 RepID=UPI000F824FA8|nr:pentapeptide repeat-containing protein [Sulfuriflexus mobilis]
MNEQIGGRWYTRRGGKVSGPFAAGLVSRHILVGRLDPKDEVSNDKENWRPIIKVPELIPEVMKGDQDDPFIHERLLAAQRWADERLQADRRLQQENSEFAGQRREGDRREGEFDEVLGHRGVLRDRELDINAENTRLGWVFLLLVLISIGWGGYYAYHNRPEEVVIDCLAKPLPGVNWQNCSLQGSELNAVDLTAANLRNTNLTGVHLQSAMLTTVNADFTNMSLGKLANADLSHASLLGANLRNADLRNANLENANLSFANLSGANLEGANLQGTILHKAIWTDGSNCAEGSVTVCSQP